VRQYLEDFFFNEESYETDPEEVLQEGMVAMKECARAGRVMGKLRERNQELIAKLGRPREPENLGGEIQI
jgi:hypothetical protein